MKKFNVNNTVQMCELFKVLKDAFPQYLGSMRSTSDMVADIRELMADEAEFEACCLDENGITTGDINEMGYTFVYIDDDGSVKVHVDDDVDEEGDGIVVALNTAIQQAMANGVQHTADTDYMVRVTEDFSLPDVSYSVFKSAEYQAKLQAYIGMRDAMRELGTK